MVIKKSPEKIVQILALILFVICISLVYSVFDLEHYPTLDINTLLYLCGKSAGLIGFLFLSILIFSGDTARFFDKFFGMDRIIKFQRKFSYIALLFILLHPIFFMIGSKSILPFLIPDFTVIPFSLGVLSLYLYCIIIIASKFYKRISYNVWQFIHILTYTLFFFAISHAFFIGTDAHHFPIRILYPAAFIMILTGIIYRTQYKLRKHYIPKFYVKKIKKETEDSFTIFFYSNKPLKFEAGQFCFLQLRKGKFYARHPFTISSTPSDSEISFTIKIAGAFTKALSELKVNEEVIVEGPFGLFTVKNREKNLVFIAGGVGITPFMSIIQDKINRNDTQKITLLYSSRKSENAIFRDRLDNIKADWFKKVYIFSGENESFKKESLPTATANVAQAGVEIGHINKDIIIKNVKNFENSQFYICGPEALKDSIKATLSDLGIKKENIIIEDFFW